MTCIWCAAEYEPKKRRADNKFCSLACKSQYHVRRRSCPKPAHRKLTRRDVDCVMRNLAEAIEHVIPRSVLP